jgi:hypothetical protein
VTVVRSDQACPLRNKGEHTDCEQDKGNDSEGWHVGTDTEDGCQEPEGDECRGEQTIYEQRWAPWLDHQIGEKPVYHE